jgi:hypothetical protein
MEIQGNRFPSYRAMGPYHTLFRSVYRSATIFKAQDGRLTVLRIGHVHIWSYETGSIVKTFELTDVPVRAGRFIARKNWLVAGSDDFQLRWWV